MMHAGRAIAIYGPLAILSGVVTFFLASTFGPVGGFLGVILSFLIGFLVGTFTAPWVAKDW